MLSNQARSKVVRVGVLAVILCALALSACGTTPTPVPVAVAPTATEAATATATSTPAPTDTSVPTDTPTPTDTPEPTDTVAPSPTATYEVTATPENTATATTENLVHMYVNEEEGGEFYEVPLELGEDGVYRGCVNLDQSYLLKWEFPPLKEGEPGRIQFIRMPTIPFKDHNGVPMNPTYLVDASYDLVKPDMVTPEVAEGLDLGYVVLNLRPGDYWTPAYTLTMNPNHLLSQLIMVRWIINVDYPAGQLPPRDTVYLTTLYGNESCPPSR